MHVVPSRSKGYSPEIRDSIVVRELEESFGVRAELMLEAISRASDLTQRGVRGVIAETVFALDVLPQLAGWQTKEIIGNNSYDAPSREGWEKHSHTGEDAAKVKGRAWVDSILLKFKRDAAGRKGE